MRKIKKFNEAEEWIYGNPGIPGQPHRKKGEQDYLASVWDKRKEQIRQQGPGIFDLQGSASAVRGHELELEALLERVFNNIYKGLVERYNIKFDIKFAKREDIAGLLNIKESLESEKYKRKLINLVGQGEAKNMMYVFHNEEFTQGIYDIFGEDKGKKLIKLWTEIVKAVDSIDVHREIDMPWRTSFIKNTVGGACKIDWNKSEEKTNEAIDDDDDFFEDPFKDDDDEDDSKLNVDDLIMNALNNGNFDEAEEIQAENNLPDNYIRQKFTPKVVARGLDFTMLIHETIKGLYLVLSIIGLPAEKEMAKRVINAGYAIREEPEEFKWGPMVASDLRDFINNSPKLTEDILNKYPNVREQFWIYMLKLESDEFLKVFRSFLNNSEEGQIKRETILKEVLKSLHAYYENKRLKKEFESKQKAYESNLKKWIESQLKKGINKQGVLNALLKAGNKQEIVEPLIEQIAAQLGPIEPKPAPTRNVEKSVEQEPDYANMSPSELDKLINAAMDKKDWDLVRKISQFIR
jgi:hypothetical protein